MKTRGSHARPSLWWYRAVALGSGLMTLSGVVAGWMVFAGERIHLVHDVGGLIILGGPLISLGFFAQVRDPVRSASSLWQVAMVAMVMLVSGFLTGVFEPMGVMVLGAALLLAVIHPDRPSLYARPGRVSWGLAGLALAGGAPLAAFAYRQLGIQGAHIPGDPHGIHWLGMGSMALSIALVAVLASLKLPGWRASAWSAGVGAAMFGLASAMFPELASSVGVNWGWATIGVAALFLELAEWEAPGSDLARARPLTKQGLSRHGIVLVDAGR